MCSSSITPTNRLYPMRWSSQVRRFASTTDPSPRVRGRGRPGRAARRRPPRSFVFFGVSAAGLEALVLNLDFEVRRLAGGRGQHRQSGGQLVHVARRGVGDQVALRVPGPLAGGVKGAAVAWAQEAAAGPVDGAAQ